MSGADEKKFKVGDIVKVVKVIETGDPDNNFARDRTKKAAIGSVLFVLNNRLSNKYDGHIYSISPTRNLGYNFEYLFHADELVAIDIDPAIAANLSFVRVVGKADPVKVCRILVIDENGQQFEPYRMLTKEEIEQMEQEKERAEKDALIKEFASKTAELTALIDAVGKLGEKIKTFST